MQCDRRLLARIHRLTLNRLRAAGSSRCTIAGLLFNGFFLAWQRVDAEHRTEGPGGAEGGPRPFDGRELAGRCLGTGGAGPACPGLPAGLARSVVLVDRLGWPPEPPGQSSRKAAFSRPIESGFLFSPENFSALLALSAAPPVNFSGRSPGPRGGAAVRRPFFREIVKQTGLLPVQAEQALAELWRRAS